MWPICFGVSIGCVAAAVLAALIFKGGKIWKNKRPKLLQLLFAGVFLATVAVFCPIHIAGATTVLSGWRGFLLAVFNAIQVFAAGCEFGLVQENMLACPAALCGWYQAWTAMLFVLAPILTFGFVLSLFKNVSAYLRYLGAFFRDVYAFSALNEKALALATDIKKNHKKAAIVFTDVFEDNEESSYERVAKAKELGAICFKKDILVVNFKRHARSKALWFFAIGEDETENIDQAVTLIESHKNRKNTHVYVFSTKVEGELLLTSVDKGLVKVRRIHEVRALINRVLYEDGQTIFRSAWAEEDGKKCISAIVVGLGNHGTEMLKALAWFGQMDGYSLYIDAFDRDSLARERFTAIAPELMDEEYNGVYVPGEAQYKITIHPGVDVHSSCFGEEIAKLKKASYVLVSLGDDSLNVQTAVNLRMYFERMGIHPVIQAIVHNTRQKNALADIKNFRGQPYDITFIGDLESSFTEGVIIDSELENNAIRRHKKWGDTESFWTYEYNYRSSIASAIHIEARIQCGIPGADKTEETLTPEERDIIETLEHRRWNAYMRSEGYVYSGSKDSSSRNDLGKMHHNLIKYADLTEEDKRKDSRVGTN
ncbi:MAG: hypothetical protein E7447_03340 [Ruminococcaceae bacterium]|nr:hypothetical protein [Oscillospiraceae bacterium]